MTSATRRPVVAALATGDVGATTSGVGIEIGDVTRDGAGGMTGCTAPESNAESRARAVSRLAPALSPRNWLFELIAFSYSARPRAMLPSFSKVRPRPTKIGRAHV